MPEGSKQTLRASLEQVYKSTGVKPDQLDLGKPPAFEYLIDWYFQAFAGDVLTMQELKAWSEMARIPLTGWEAQMIKEIDRIFWKVKRD